MTGPDDPSRSGGSIEELQAALDAVDDLFYVFTADGTLRYWNDALPRVTGYSDAEIAAMTPADFFAPTDRSEIDVALSRVLEDEDVRVAATLQTKDGDHLPYEFSGASFHRDGRDLVAGFGRNIRERKEAEQQRQLYEYACNSALAGIAIGTLEGELQSVNPMFLEMWGYDAEDEVLGRSVTEFWADETEAGSVATAVRETGAWEGQLLAVRADGSEFHAQCSASLVTDDDGEPFAMMAAFVDITERVERERELQRQREQLDEFASVVSHDLRNPLNVAASRIELAREEADSDHLAHAMEALDRMEAIIEDTLLLARDGQTVADREWVEMDSLATASWGMVETGDAAVTVPRQFEVRADEARLRHLLENLFRNAVEHGDGESTVRIGPLGRSGFFVEDDGPGIPADQRDRVLEPGVTTKRGGTGFGLAIVNRIAQAHGWEVTVHEGGAGGARFEFANVEIRPPSEQST
jgi:PAS domain S-box-containing protein